MDYQKLYDQKLIQIEDLNSKMNQITQQSNFIISDMQQQIKQLKRKNQALNKQLNDLKFKSQIKKKNFSSTVQRQIQLAKKQRNQFRNKFLQFQKKVIGLQNINQQLQNDLRSTQSILDQYKNQAEKTMEQLAVVQIQLEQKTQSSQQPIARLKNNLKQAQDELYVLHNVKHKKQQIQKDKSISDKSIIVNPVDTSIFKTTLNQIRAYLQTFNQKKQLIRKQLNI